MGTISNDAISWKILLFDRYIIECYVSCYFSLEIRIINILNIYVFCDSVKMVKNLYISEIFQSITPGHDCDIKNCSARVHAACSVKCHNIEGHNTLTGVT